MKVHKINGELYFKTYDVVHAIAKAESDTRNFFMNTYMDSDDDPDINEVVDHFDDLIYEEIRKPLLKYNDIKCKN